MNSPKRRKLTLGGYPCPKRPLTVAIAYLCSKGHHEVPVQSSRSDAEPDHSTLHPTSYPPASLNPGCGSSLHSYKRQHHRRQSLIQLPKHARAHARTRSHYPPHLLGRGLFADEPFMPATAVEVACSTSILSDQLLAKKGFPLLRLKAECFRESSSPLRVREGGKESRASVSSNR